MTDKQILLQLENYADNNDFQNFEKQLDELFKVTDEANASLLLSAFLMNRYSSNLASETTKLLELVIHKKPELALLNFPDNCFFQAAVLRGSFELYQCYMEEAIEPYLYDKSSEEAYKCYMNLNTVADRYNALIFERLPKYVKGKDFKGAVAPYKEDASLTLINDNDLDFMERIIENYNGILGRRDILKDLEARLIE
jgi:hypothetical protein